MGKGQREMDMGKRTTDNENKGQGDMRQRYGGKGKGKGAKQKVTKETRKKDKRPGLEDERQSAMVRGTWARDINGGATERTRVWSQKIQGKGQGDRDKKRVMENGLETRHRRHCQDTQVGGK